MKKKIIIAVVIVCVVCFAGVVVAGLSGVLDEENTTTTKPSTSDIASNEKSTEISTEKEITTKNKDIRFGELLDVIENDDLVVVKAKITSSYSNKTTIEQNYYNVADLIQNKGYNKYSELQYWAVADMNDGSEQKVISFTLNKETIDNIYNKKIVDNQIGDYVDELWLHPSLEK